MTYYHTPLQEARCTVGEMLKPNRTASELVDYATNLLPLLEIIAKQHEAIESYVTRGEQP